MTLPSKGILPAVSKLSIIVSKILKFKMAGNSNKNLFIMYIVGSLCMVRWSYAVTSINLVMHALEGNRQNSYDLVAWNCNRALVLSTENDSATFLDIKLYIQKYKPHMFAVIESDLHGPNTTATHRTTTFTKETLKDKLYIEGYKIEFPMSWESFGQARIIVFVSENIRAKQIKLSLPDSDLPSMSFEVGLGREKKSIVNFYYCEFTGLATGKSQAAQKDRLNRQVLHWRSLAALDRDILLLGDAILMHSSGKIMILLIRILQT